ncbi:MAG TPA: M1 family aminopeptidase [Bryobacteraceae bacterium]|nr:M1 family aminopeptidase [Bryobacteraceae bacterium]
MMRGPVWAAFRAAAALLPLAAFAAGAPAFRLPDGVVPVKHAIELSIDPARSEFQGRGRIEVDLRKPTAEIWLNGRDLVPGEASVESGGRTLPARVSPVRGEFLRVRLDSEIGPGRAIVSIEYRGHLSGRSVLGAFRRKVAGDWYVYTTFTPIEARTVFPCFDEPRFKTPWEISIRVPQGDKAYSNAPEIAETDEPGGNTLVRFATTKPLPAEVVAFAVGPFSAYQGTPASDGTPVRVLTPRGRAVEGKAAAEATAAVLPKLEAYTGIPYPFRKLDHLALPESAFGAVENPGLIVYLSRELLVTPGTDTNPRTHALRTIEAHEIAHQWFGDLVTQASWQDVWLSEGFATWLSDKIMGSEEPPERARLAAIARRERIMHQDSSKRAHPVRMAVRNREESKNIYNSFVYDKGASVLLMLEGWLGEDQLRDGLRDYLKDRQFGNASTADLESELKKAAHVDPTAVMNAFLDRTGVPGISAGVKCDGAARLEIRETGPSPVPVCWRTGTAEKSCNVVNRPSSTFDLPSCPAWIYLNAGGTGYYRTEWSAAQLAALPLDRLTPAERLTLAYDLRAQGADSEAARSVLAKLAADPEPEIAAAAGLRRK